MDEGRRNEHAGAKVSRDEEKLVWDGEFWEALCDDGERTSWQRLVRIRAGKSSRQAGKVRTSGAHSEDENQCKDMDGRVVGAPPALGSARWPPVVLSAEKLSTEQVCRYVGPREA